MNTQNDISKRIDRNGTIKNILSIPIKNIFIQTIYWEIKGLLLYLFSTPSKEPWMTDSEKELFYKSISDSNIILEFGSGGSTFYALKQGKKIFSIESSAWFIRMMKKSPLIKDAINRNHLLYYYANMGTTKEYSIPLHTDNGDIYWKKSIEEISSMENQLVNHFLKDVDTIFIDGRYRVSCALNALRYFKNAKKFIIHDYNNRPQYHILEKFFIREDEAGSLVIFSPRPNINIDDINNNLLIYRNIYD